MPQGPTMFKHKLILPYKIGSVGYEATKMKQLINYLANLTKST